MLLDLQYCWGLLDSPFVLWMCLRETQLDKKMHCVNFQHLQAGWNDAEMRLGNRVHVEKRLGPTWGSVMDQSAA